MWCEFYYWGFVLVVPLLLLSLEHMGSIRMKISFFLIVIESMCGRESRSSGVCLVFSY